MLHLSKWKCEVIYNVVKWATMLEIQVKSELSEWGSWGALSEKLFLASAE